jgi:MFS family permease
MLIFFRVLQGTTGGGLQPLSQAVLLEEFPGRERGKAMAFWGMGIVAAPILGPTIGGWITDSYSWRWVFYINVPVGILSLFLIYLFVHDPQYIRRGTLRADLWGLGMLALGMGALQIMLDKGQEKDWFGSELIKVLAVMAAVFLTAFVIRELTVKDPIVHFHLLRFRAFATGIGLAAVLGFVLYGSLILLPLFMQTLLGWTAATAGIWTSPRGIGTALCMPLVGYILGRGWDFLGRTGVLRLRKYDVAIRHMGHLLVPDIAGGCDGTAVCAPDHLDHGLHSAAGDRVCHQPLQRDAQHRVQHGDLLCDHMDHAALPVSSIHSGVSHYRFEPDEPGGDGADYGLSATQRHRPRNGQARGRSNDLSDDATAGRAAELRGRVSHHGIFISNCDPVGLPHEAASPRHHSALI